MNTNPSTIDVAAQTDGRQLMSEPPLLGRFRLGVLLAITALPIVLTTVLAPFVAATGIHGTLPFPVWSFALYGVMCWVGLGLVLAVGRPSRLKAYGLRFKWTAGRVGAAVVGFVAGNAIYLIVTWVLRRVSLPTIGGMDFEPSTGVAFLVMALATAVTAPVCEEVFFRVLWVGALAPRIGTWAAGALSILFFAASHYPYFGVGGVAFIAAWSLVPLVLFLRYGDLTAPVLMHVLNNVWAYLILPLFPGAFD